MIVDEANRAASTTAAIETKKPAELDLKLLMMRIRNFVLIICETVGMLPSFSAYVKRNLLLLSLNNSIIPDYQSAVGELLR